MNKEDSVTNLNRKLAAWVAVRTLDRTGRRVLTALGLAVVAATCAITAGAKDGGNFLEIRAKDECDPVTFGATRCFGPETGGVTLQEFTDAIPNGGHEEWKFRPGVGGTRVNRGGMAQVRSHGGVRHTFTRVAEFGGGFVPGLNAAVGNAPTVAECQAAQTQPDSDTSVNVTQGSVKQFIVGQGGLFPRGANRYQCCIHPWMRATITVR